MQIRPFAVEQWMNDFETTCEWNLAETCCESITVATLLDLAGHSPDRLRDELLAMHLTYGDIVGSDRLRSAVAALFERQTADDVLVTHGAIGANHLTHLALVEPGDRVVAAVPNYQQHTSIPASIGADVRQLRLRPELQYLPDLDELASLVGDDCKLVAITNPNNPTGALIEQPMLEEIASICRAAGAWLLCDEVYRGIDQHGSGTTASVADLYEKGISTGSMSKAFSMAGVRLGWIVAPPEVIEAAMHQRDYSTISVSMVDDHLASIALEHSDAILERNRSLVRANNATVDEWLASQDALHWVRPTGGTTGLLHYPHTVASRELCIHLLEQTGVLLTPGSALDTEGTLRLGYANHPDVLANGLDRLGAHMASTPMGRVQGVSR